MDWEFPMSEQLTIATNMHSVKVLDKHCMIDLETLGSNPKAPVVQIGLVFFTVQGITLQSQLTINFDDALKHGEADGSTIKWWLEQPKDAQNTLFVNPLPILEAASIFDKLVEAQNANFYWAHATFDFPILLSMFRALNKKYPLPYKRCYDLRTLEYISGPIEWDKREGTHHNALDDAVYQAKHAIKLLNKIGRG